MQKCNKNFQKNHKSIKVLVFRNMWLHRFVRGSHADICMSNTQF